MLLMTAVETGEVKILDSLKKFINPQMFDDFRIRALGNAGAFAEAFKALPAIPDPARRQAIRKASDRLLKSAMPFPAILNAVPWSTLVRMIGRPRVELTPRSNASILNGIWPWS